MADVIRNLRMGKRTCIAMDYIDALYAVFGRVKTTSDLMYKFNHTYQQKGERLSGYISQLVRILHQIILKDPKDIDQASLEWVLQGAWPNHPIVLKLLLRRTKVVPTYPELIREVREEEALLEEKSQGTRESSTTAVNRERVFAQTVHVEAGFSDEDSETESELAGLAISDTISQ